MSIFEAIVQGIVQGATEFLPVSSSGHLSLAQHIMGVKVDSLLFDILLHLGTLIAVCAVYYKLIWRLIKAFISLVADVFRGKFKWKDMDHDRRLLMMLMIGLIPLFLLFLPVPGTGMKLKDISELWASDSTIWIEGLALLMTSALLFLGIRASKGAKVHHFTRKNGKVGEIRGRTKFHTADAICVGVTQCAAAVFPGLSRSGSTMAAGLLRGINQQAALDYDLEDLSARRLAHGAYVVCNVYPAAVLDHGEVYHHVYLVRAVLYRVSGLKSLDGARHVAVREADDRAYFKLIADVTLRARHVTGRDAYACAVILYRLVAELSDLLARAVDAQEGMVAFFQYILDVHNMAPFHI